MSRRHALVIGIDTYPGFGPESQLAGAVRDAETMAAVLTERHGFAPGDVLRLFETEATRGAILEALEELRRRVSDDDQVVLFFSGHGSQMPDREGDEGDGLDETLVPCDSSHAEAENRDITDDEINHWAASVLEVTPHLTLIFDCCHGGTLQRPGWRIRRVPADLRPVELLPPSPVIWRDVDPGPRPLVATACRDDEAAVELPPSVAGADRGAFSFHFIEALRRAGKRATWRKVFARATRALAVHCPDQHPQLSGDGLDVPVFSGGRTADRGQAGRRLLDLAARPNRAGLVMELYRSRGGAWMRQAEPSFVEGDRLRVDLHHEHEREVFVYLLDVGLTGTVTLLFPDLEGHEPLEPGLTLTVGERRGDALELFLPHDLPPHRPGGVGHLIAIVSENRRSTPRLLSGSDIGVLAAIARPYRLSRD